MRAVRASVVACVATLLLVGCGGNGDPHAGDTTRTSDSTETETAEASPSPVPLTTPSADPDNPDARTDGDGSIQGDIVPVGKVIDYSTAEKYSNKERQTIFSIVSYLTMPVTDHMLQIYFNMRGMGEYDDYTSSIMLVHVAGATNASLSTTIRLSDLTVQCEGTEPVAPEQLAAVGHVRDAGFIPFPQHGLISNDGEVITGDGWLLYSFYKVDTLSACVMAHQPEGSDEKQTVALM